MVRAQRGFNVRTGVIVKVSLYDLDAYEVSSFGFLQVTLMSVRVSSLGGFLSGFHMYCGFRH